MLGAEAQQALLDKLTMIEAGLRSGPVPEELLAQVQRRTAFLLGAFVAELVQAGREDVVVATAEEVLGEDAVPSVRAWIERTRQNGGARQT